MKRYYVEVMGLGEDGETQLIEAGIEQKAILVIDEEEQRNIVANAIREVTGITFEAIKSDQSTRYVVMARTIYVHFMIEAGFSVGKICDDIGRTQRDIYRYITEFDDKMQGDKEFCNEVSDVMCMLERTVEWNDRMRMREKKRIANTKKRKKRRKRKKMQKQKETNQLYINF